MTSGLRIVVLACAAVALSGCPQETKHAQPVTPDYTEPCKHYECGDSGMCASTAAGMPKCLCEVGYGGSRCDGCESGFHRDSIDRCVPDRSCAQQPWNPCGDYGSCDDSTGVIECHCDPGYEGPRCNLCMTGYDHDDNRDCLQLFLPGGSENGDGDGDGDGDPDPDEPPEGCDIPKPCYDHGQCDDSGPDAACICETGYAGGRCAQCDEAYEPVGAVCVIVATCEEGQCGAHGECDAFGFFCECDPGYEGAACDDCQLGYHETEESLCEQDTSCVGATCPLHASCDDSSGVAVCTCSTGYAGDACDACQPAFVRNEAFDTCISVSCQDNPIPSGQTVTYDGSSDFPVGEDSCVSGATVDTTEMILHSIDGDGVVWACAPSTLYGVESKHVFIEAGSRGPGELIFAGPIASLSFDYGARSALSLELSGDGHVLQTLDAARRTHGALSLTFSPAITVLSMRAMNSFTNQLALDNLVYTPCD